jgi:adenosylmethionine-8-amino-7-oxononanoate aminotransferase
MVDVQTRETLDTEALRRSSLEHQWMHFRDWLRMAEEGDPTIIVSGKGLEVVDSNGDTWMDVNGGYLCVNVGYGRTDIADAAMEQMRKLAYFPQATTTEVTARFCQKLAEITPGDLDRVWPVTGGSEANETAVKIAKAYHHRRGDGGRYKIISRKGSYHGGLGLTMWLGGHGGRHDFEPAYPGMIYAPQANAYRPEMGGTTIDEIAENAVKAVEDLIILHGPETIAAFIGEPIVGDTASDAVTVPGPTYWPRMREVCDKYGIVLIIDEVINGFGRTGKMFASEHWDFVPDIMTMGKGLISSYLPLAATIVSTRIADAFAGEKNVFPQALTYGGHPVAAAAALKNIAIIEDEGLVENSRKTGAYMKEQLEGVKADHPIVGDVRGIGLLLAIELVKNRETKELYPDEMKLEESLAEKFHEQHLIIRPRGHGLISLSPPLCVTREEVDRIVAGIDIVLGQTEKELGVTG